MKKEIETLSKRFQGFYPVVIDIETGGFDYKNDAILEIAAVTLKMDKKGWLTVDKKMYIQIAPFFGSKIEINSLKFNKIDLNNPSRKPINENIALNKIFKKINAGIKNNNCKQAIIVAHNANFDHNFIMEAIKRNKIKKNPFHKFVTIDTATLSNFIFGQKILYKSCISAGIYFDGKKAHCALYDAHKTALLFCKMINKWKKLGGWPPNLKIE